MLEGREEADKRKLSFRNNKIMCFVQARKNST